MLIFLANNIEQIDLALEHVSKGDANNARFGLMLIDNVIEITLHQIAKDKQSESKSFLYRDKAYEHAAALQDALGQHFESKVKFVRKIGKLDVEVSESVNIFHSFRNEVYHIGVHHEAILPAIAKFYFKLACDFLGAYSPLWLGYSPGMKLPERASKYFGEQKYYMNGIEQYHEACRKLGDAVTIVPLELVSTLADHMDEVIEEQDTAVDMIATGGPRRSSRDEAVADTLAWRIAFSEKGKQFAQERGWNKGSVLDFVRWIGTHYPLPLKKDPIPEWKTRSLNVRHERNPHKGLKKYRDFMSQTADVRMAFGVTGA